MSITLGAATKLLDDMMVNYSEWHTERAPTGKKVNSVEEISSLSDKVDAIMNMISNGHGVVDPNNVPLASLVAHDDNNVDVNFIKNNNFNNNAYRNNFGNNNYRPYPANGNNSYGNSYGNSYSNNRSVSSEIEVMLKDFISTQTTFNKTVEEKLGKIDTLAAKVDSLAHDVEMLKIKAIPSDIRESKTLNAIQVKIDNNIRMLAELHERWEREEREAEIAEQNSVVRVCTIFTNEIKDASHAHAPHVTSEKVVSVGNVSTISAKKFKLPDSTTDVPSKSAEISRDVGDNGALVFDDNTFNFENCNITEVIMFLQKLAKSPNGSKINRTFTEHIIKALMHAREEKLKLEASIPRKLHDSWEPVIKMKLSEFECNALCDLGSCISVMPKIVYDILKLAPLENCDLDVHFADSSMKKPLGKVDDVLIMVNNNLVPVDFVVMDIECNPSCPIVLGRPFLRTVGAVIDMKEGNIKFQFPLKKGMEHFPRKKMKFSNVTSVKTNYGFGFSGLDNT